MFGDTRRVAGQATVVRTEVGNGRLNRAEARAGRAGRGPASPVAILVGYCGVALAVGLRIARNYVQLSGFTWTRSNLGPGLAVSNNARAAVNQAETWSNRAESRTRSPRMASGGAWSLWANLHTTERNWWKL